MDLSSHIIIFASGIVVGWLTYLAVTAWAVALERKIDEEIANRKRLISIECRIAVLEADGPPLESRVSDPDTDPRVLAERKAREEVEE